MIVPFWFSSLVLLFILMWKDVDDNVSEWTTCLVLRLGTITETCHHCDFIVGCLLVIDVWTAGHNQV